MRWAAIWLSGCAGTGGVTERAFTRDVLADLELRSLDVVVVAKGPPLASGPALDVSPFDAPRHDAVLFEGPDDVETRRALSSALASELATRGFAVRLVHAHPHEAGAPGAPRFAPLPPIETSTTVPTASAAVALAFGPPIVDLEPTATLADVLRASPLDAVLVVRVVIVDEFHLHVPGTGAPELSETGRVLRQRPAKAYPVRGRLLVGQAFLFDRRTGLRLWSRQLPSFPEGGRIFERDPFLRFGFVQTDKSAMEERAKADRAAAAFVPAMLAEFPRSQAGTPEARASLDAVDAQAELRELSFFDDSHILLEVGLGWAAEGSGADLVLDGVELPPVGTGAVSPQGIGRIGVRGGYVAPSGLALSLEARFGLAPSSFARSYHRDGEAFDRSRNANVRIDGANAYAGALGAGYLLLVAEDLFLLPSGAVFLDAWAVRAEPDTVVLDGTHLRFGAELGLDVLYAFTSLVFGRIGVGAKAGADTSGPPFVGIGGSLGLGLFL
jgi:hypothetical protein